MVIGLAGLMLGFSWFRHGSKSSQTVEEARKDLEDGDLYQARKKIQKLLKKNPSDTEAQRLMAEIIDQEIARHKEVFENNAPEELPRDAKQEEIRTWLERGKTLMELKRYEEALLATERVFAYDPQNMQASRLSDEIRSRAVKAGKQQMLIEREIYKEQVTEKVGSYTKKARFWINQNRWGAAKLAVDKTLLLQPFNKEALQLQKEIEAHNAQLNTRAGAAATAENPAVSVPAETTGARP